MQSAKKILILWELGIGKDTYTLGVKGNEPNLKQTIYSSFLIWLTDSSSGISSTIKTEFGQEHSVPK